MPIVPISQNMKTGNRAIGIDFSASSMSQKFGWAIGTAVTGWLLSFFGFQANAVQSEETIHGIQNVLKLASGCSCIYFDSLYCLLSAGRTEDERYNGTVKLKERIKR